MWRRLIGIVLVIGMFGMAARAQAPAQQAAGRAEDHLVLLHGEMGRTE